MMANPKFKKTIEWLLGDSGGGGFERFDGTLALFSLDDPGSVTRNIANSEIVTNQAGVSQWRYDYTSSRNLITRVDVKYKPIFPLDGEFASVKFCSRGKDNFGFVDADNNGGSYYQGLLEKAYEAINEERPLTVEAYGVRDEETAEKLARLIIKWRFKQLALLNLVCTYEALDIELGDKIGVTGDVVPLFLRNKRFLTVGWKPQPHVGQKDPLVRLGLIEIGDSTETVVEEWQDTFDTGTEYQDAFATGEVVQEVA